MGVPAALADLIRLCSHHCSASISKWFKEGKSIPLNDGESENGEIFQPDLSEAVPPASWPFVSGFVVVMLMSST